MHSAFKRLIIGIVIITLSITTSYAKPYEVHEVRYNNLGAFKGYLCKPPGKGPFPTVIYSYDEFIDWAGSYVAKKRGYNLKQIAKDFAKKGYAVFIPIERFRKVQSVLGAVEYMSKKPYVNKRRMHLMGVSEGAFINLIVLENTDKIRSSVCIAPIGINDKGYLSTNNLKAAKNKQTKILFLEAKDVGWRINSQAKVYHAISKQYPNLYHKAYYVKKRWFWFHHHPFMKDVHEFFRKQ